MYVVFYKGNLIMKNFFTTIALLSCVLTFFPNLTFARCGMVETNFTSLNIRNRPSTQSRIIGTAAKGSALRIINSGNYWAKVKLNNGRIGYARGDYIRSYGVCAVVAIKSGSLNIRRSPSKRSRIVGRASKGSAVTILTKKYDWSRVKLNNGRTGYASMDYLY